MTWTHNVTDVFGNEHELDLQYLVLWSDPHINHRPNPKTGEGGILKYGRGHKWTTVEAMNHGLLDNLYDALRVYPTEKKRRQLLITGDVVMAIRDEGLPLVADVVDHAGVEAFLVPGNHDHCHPMHHKKYEDWQERYRDLGRLITLPVELTMQTIIGELTVCHFPFASIGDHTEDLRYASWRPEDRGQWLIHGHLHGTKGKLTSPRSVDVGVDSWDYGPVLFKHVLKLLRQEGAQQ